MRISSEDISVIIKAFQESENTKTSPLLVPN